MVTPSSFSRTGELRGEKRGEGFGSWAPSSLFRHSLFSPTENTSDAASLPAPGASEFQGIRLSAARSDLRRRLICCTSRQRVCAQTHQREVSQVSKQARTFDRNNKRGNTHTGTFLFLYFDIKSRARIKKRRQTLPSFTKSDSSKGSV